MPSTIQQPRSAQMWCHEVAIGWKLSVGMAVDFSWHSYNPLRNLKVITWLFSCSQSGQYYFYDQSVRRCRTMTYRGCGGNRNRFDTNSECLQICSAVVNRLNDDFEVFAPDRQTDNTQSLMYSNYEFGVSYIISYIIRCTLSPNLF